MSEPGYIAIGAYVLPNGRGAKGKNFSFTFRADSNSLGQQEMARISKYIAKTIKAACTRTNLKKIGVKL